jgi:hypothetical protein
MMRSVLRAAIYFIFFMLGVVLFTLGPKLEVLMNPVVGAFKIEKIWQEGNRYFVEGALLKIRGECEPTEIVMFAGGGFEDKNAKIIKIGFSTDPIQGDSGFVARPKGAQHWGPWELTPPSEPLGPIVSLAVTHRCHSLWHQTQVIYTGLTRDFFPDLTLDTYDGD